MYQVLDATGEKLLGLLIDSLRAAGQAAEQQSLAGSRSAAITAGQKFSVPPYTVGGAQLEVYIDGVACICGRQYAESGVQGAVSTVIIWNMEISTDRDILVRVK